jgi:hypothetical protein
VVHLRCVWSILQRTSTKNHVRIRENPKELARLHCPGHSCATQPRIHSCVCRGMCASARACLVHSASSPCIARVDICTGTWVWCSDFSPPWVILRHLCVCPQTLTSPYSLHLALCGCSIQWQWEHSFAVSFAPPRNKLKRKRIFSGSRSGG